MKGKNFFDLKGRVAIITGGAGELGSAYAEALAHSGAHVHVWDIAPEAVTKKAAAALRRRGANVTFDLVDITSEKSVADAVKRVLKTRKRIDILINAAAVNHIVDGVVGSAQFAAYENYPIDLWEKEVRVNLTGMMICMKHVAPVMIKQNSGSIINVASDVAVTAHDKRVYGDPEGKKFKSIAYVTTKTGVLGLTRQWASRLGEHNVRVNSFSHSGVWHKGQPEIFVKRYGESAMMGRMARAEDCVGPLLFLCSDASQFMTAQNLIIDGGKSAW